MNNFGLVEMYQLIGINETDLSTRVLVFLLSYGKHCQVVFINFKTFIIFFAHGVHMEVRK